MTPATPVFTLLHRHPARTLVVSVLVLCLATVGYFEGFNRYAPVGDEHIPQPLSDSWRSQLHGANGLTFSSEGLIIANTNPDGYAGLQFDIPRPPNGWLQLRGTFSTSAITPGSKTWHNARVLLGGLDDNNRWHWLGQHSVLFGTAKQRDTFDARMAIPIPAHYPMVRVTLELPRATGQLRAHALSLVPVQETALSHILHAILLASWLCLALACLWLLGARLRSPATLIILVLLTAPLLLPKTQRDQLSQAATQTSDYIADWTDQHTPEPAAETTPTALDTARATLNQSLQRAGLADRKDHIGVFILLSLLLSYHGRHRPIWQTAGSLILLAIATELAQYLSPGRTPSMSDLVSNLGGIAVGVCGWQVGRWGWRKTMKE